MSPTLGAIDIAPLTQTEAEAIAGWRYEPPYDFYDASADPGDLAELLDEARRGDGYFAAHDAAGELIGYFSFKEHDPALDIGLGLRPDLTGRGLGQPFLEAGLEFARSHFAPPSFRLRVATFNVRAIKVYERTGFTRMRTFTHRTNGGRFPFLEMERPA